MNVLNIRRKSQLVKFARTNSSPPSSERSASPDSRKSKALPPRPKSLLLGFYQRGSNAMIAYGEATVHYHVSISTLR